MINRVGLAMILALSSILFSLSNVGTSATQAAVTLASFNARLVNENATTQIVLTWKTASEIRTAGFNLYRSMRAEGPYTRINAQLIPASNDLLTGGTYQYVDQDIQSDQTWYYQLEDVEFNGPSVRHSPINVASLAPPFGFPAWLITATGIGVIAGVVGILVLVLRPR